jgi:hypothetical protein
MKRFLPILSALALLVIAFLNMRGVFGPDNGTVSDRYPTLLVAADYAFSIWSVIFLLDLAFVVWQWRQRGEDETLDRIRHYAFLGFGFSAVWMIVFSKLHFWLALAIIWAALGSMVLAALASAHSPAGSAAGHRLPRWSTAMHAGWLSLAAFLNTAQVIVAYQLLPADAMLAWSAVLWLGAAVLVLAINRRLGAHPAYWLPVLWGLAAVVVEQSRGALPGAQASALIAGVLAAVVIGQVVQLWRRERQSLSRNPAPADGGAR